MTTWTNCADKMPPDTSEEFIIRYSAIRNGAVFLYSGVHVNLFLYDGIRNQYEWVPYTLKLWNELTK